MEIEILHLFSNLWRLLVICAFLATRANGQQEPSRSCRYLPQDSQWPSDAEWDALNSTVDGRLIRTIPMAHVCHEEPFQSLDVERCDLLKTEWDFAETYLDKPGEMMSATAQNKTCDPFTPTKQPCDLGNYASFSIEVTSAEDVVAGISFAKEHNLRLAIMNTGHDYRGRSTGAGSLSLWTRNLQSTSFIRDYKSDQYDGPAIRVGAGVVAGELYEEVAALGYRVVGGTCASVGIAGGYAAGGGHSILSGLYGLGADNVLEWEVVLADGKHVKASPDNEHSDLYWAMTGGGPGVWGVVLSMTYRVHTDGPVGGASLEFNATGSGPDAYDADVYWEAVDMWHAWQPEFTEALGGGNTAQYMYSATTFSAFIITIPHARNTTEVDTLMDEYLRVLDDLGIAYDYESRVLDTFRDHYDADLGPLPYGPWEASTFANNRIVPREIMLDSSERKAFVEEIRSMTEYQDGYFFIGCQSVHMPEAEMFPDNAVVPAWRNMSDYCNTVGYWDWEAPIEDMLAHQEYLVTEILPAIEAVTSGGAWYMNEMDMAYQGDWKTEFYGGNYDKLLEVKQKYDPDGTFYVLSGVGSDAWEIDSEGRLCRA